MNALDFISSGVLGVIPPLATSIDPYTQVIPSNRNNWDLDLFKSMIPITIIFMMIGGVTYYLVNQKND